MALRDSVQTILGSAWHVASKVFFAALLPAVDGAVEASKVPVLDANKALDVVRTASLRLGASGSEVEITATAAEINRAADVSGRIVSLTTATPTIDEATHDGKTLVLNRATGVAVALPAATGSGAKYRFVVGTTFSGGSFVATVTGDDTLKGLALGLDGEGVPANAWAAGASDEIFTMDGSTQGGVVGDEVVFEDIKADVWMVQARLQQSGTEASPFSSAA